MGAPGVAGLFCPGMAGPAGPSAGGSGPFQNGQVTGRKLGATIFFPPAGQIPGVARFPRAGERLYAFYDPAQSPVYRVMADLAQALPVRDIRPSGRAVDEILADLYREMGL